MFHRQTLFVLGAGTSAEAGMPIGTKLATEIGKKMDLRFDFGNRAVGDGDNALFAHLTGGLSTDVQELNAAAGKIRDGIALAQSIDDDFIDQHRNDQYINLYGKVAIARTILDAERSSKMALDHMSDGR
jgi:hypothetical protein